MKRFILTINFNGTKAHTDLDTEEINPDYSKVTPEEIKKAYTQLEFAIDKIKEMQAEMIHKMRELNEKQTS
jgi:hypothetical protein